MPAINLAYLEFRLSGGASNADPDASLGGVMSSTAIRSASATGLSNISGLTILDAPGSASGNGTLAWDITGGTLTWTPAGGSSGDPIVIAEDGRYAIPGSEGHLYVEAVYSSLPAQSESDTIAVTPIANALWDNIGKAEAFAGDVEYRCAYITNVHPTDPFIGAKLFIGSQPTGADTLALALDLAGIGDGSSTGVADTVADENTAPDPSLTFAAPATLGTALTVGQLAAGDAIAFWQQRTVPANTLTSTPEDRSHLIINAGY
jgi:hypothetical protein